MKLYHATKKSNLENILKNGLQTNYYGKVHGSMEYGPPSPAVYVSTNEKSSNLNSNLFNDTNDPVIILQLNTKYLDSSMFFPDDAFFYMLFEDWLCDVDEMVDDELQEYINQSLDTFAEQFGILDKEKASRIFIQLCTCADDMTEFHKIAKHIGLEYLIAQGEAAYLGDIPKEAIITWNYYIDPTGPTL